MAYPISNVYRRVQYTGSAGTGPYSFSFEILSNTDIAVYKNQTLLTLTTNYTVTINANGTGYVTLVSAATGSDTITIYGSRALQRTSDFVTGGDLFANTLNDELDSLVIFTQQNKEEISRALMAPVTDPTTINLTLPGKTSRAGYVLSFNSSTGDPEVTTTVGQINQAQTYALNAQTSQNAAAASADAALVSEGNASTSASASAASAAAAAASVNGGMYSAVQDKSANYTVTSADAGDLIRVTTTSGVVTITLPLIGSAGIGDGFKVAIVKWTSDSNSVTITRSGSNTINGVTAYSIGTQYNSATLVADAETGQWFVAPSGIGTANIVLDVFSGNGSQTAFTLANDPGSKNNTFVYVGTAYQQKSSYSLSGAVLTFNSAPAAGTNNIEIAYVQTQAIGVPSDGTVTTTKIADANVTLAKLSATGTPSSTTYLRGDNTWATIQAGFNNSAVTSSAVDITLTSASAQTQAISMTATGKYVILPNATTLLTKGGPIFIIQNKGQNPFGIKDASGNVIANMVYYGQSVSLVLLSNAASAGSWGTQVIGSAGVAGIGPINASAISLYPGTDVVVCGLSSTQALIAYTNSSGANYQVVLATISGSTVTYGTPTTLATPASSIRAICSLSSTLGIFFVGSQLIAVSVSGSTLTVGTASAAVGTSLYTMRCNLLQESATAGVVIFSTDNGSTTTIGARGFTVSGTTITLGTTQNLFSVAATALNTQCATAKLATGSYVSIYSDTATSVSYARPWTSSAGTVTLGTQTTYASTTQQYTYITYAAQTGGGFGASSTCGVFSYASYNVTVVISGSTISSTSTSYGPSVTFGGAVSYSAPIGTPSPFGTTGVIATNGTDIAAYTGSANGWGGGVYLGSSSLINISTTANYSYLDSTTNLYAGNYNGLVSAVVVKGN